MKNYLSLLLLDSLVGFTTPVSADDATETVEVKFEFVNKMEEILNIYYDSSHAGCMVPFTVSSIAPAATTELKAKFISLVGCHLLKWVFGLVRVRIGVLSR